jgi:hypothetical protein
MEGWDVVFAEKNQTFAFGFIRWETEFCQPMFRILRKRRPYIVHGLRYGDLVSSSVYPFVLACKAEDVRYLTVESLAKIHILVCSRLADLPCHAPAVGEIR